MAVTLPITFKALGQEAEGGPIVAVQSTVPSLQTDEVLVRVSHSSINAMDPKLKAFNMFKIPYPMVLGFDFSGTVVAAGSSEDTDGIRIGSSVFGFATMAGGCFAEYVKVKRSYMILRGYLPETEAAAYGVAYLSAWEPLMIVDDLSKRSGQWAYVAGGAGGVGHYGVQLCKAYGLNVIASASKPASIELLKSLGVMVVDYGTQDVVKEVLAATGGKGADLVFDSTYSPSSFLQSAAVVASGGRWVKLGDFARVPDSEAAVREAVAARGGEVAYGDLGRYWYVPQYAARVGELHDGLRAGVRLFEEGKVRPRITAVIPFDAAAVAEALDGFGGAKSNVGKVLIKVA